jgi:thiamine-phosphate pyrophosphorylase
MSEPRCRLFLVSPANCDAESFPSSFELAAKAGDVASLLIRPTGTQNDTIDVISAVLAAGYEYNVAVLVDGDAEIAAESGADGVQIAGDLEAYERSRTLLGSDRIVGFLSNGSRHAAMEVGEAGADYVAFDQSHALTIGSGDSREQVDPITWWSGLFEIPSVAFAPADIGAVEPLVRAGSSFIRPNDAMWSSPDRAADTVKRYNARIEEVE